MSVTTLHSSKEQLFRRICKSFHGNYNFLEVQGQFVQKRRVCALDVALDLIDQDIVHANTEKRDKKKNQKKDINGRCLHKSYLS